MASPTNLLDYVRSVSKVDFDSQDKQLAEEIGPFVDCTSNQIDAYFELAMPRRTAVLRECVQLARTWKEDFANVAVDELAGEISMCAVSLSMLPYMTGLILVMANPKYATSSIKLVENAQRIADLCHRLDPTFDLSRLCIKVTATWEGLQACRKLKQLGIKTLATTLFTLEQAILAAEAGCVYVSPFVHPLNDVLNGIYDEKAAMLEVSVNAQKYYQQHSYSTQVKAAAIMSVDEVKKLGGVAAMTLPADLIKQLLDLPAEAGLDQLSLLNAQNQNGLAKSERVSFVNEEEKYREAFGKSAGGTGKAMTEQAIETFTGYQVKLETLMKETAASDM